MRSLLILTIPLIWLAVLNVDEKRLSVFQKIDHCSRCRSLFLCCQRLSFCGVCWSFWGTTRLRNVPIKEILRCNSHSWIILLCRFYPSRTMGRCVFEGGRFFSLLSYLGKTYTWLVSYCLQLLLCNLTVDSWCISRFVCCVNWLPSCIWSVEFLDFSVTFKLTFHSTPKIRLSKSLLKESLLLIIGLVFTLNRLI